MTARSPTREVAMAKAYPIELRARVLADCDAGLGTAGGGREDTRRGAGVGRLKQHRRERGGDIAPRTGGGRRGTAKIDRARLAALVARRPDATLLELADGLGVTCAK